MNKIQVIGPKGRADHRLVNTTSRSPDQWSLAFSPFHLGPVPLYGGKVSQKMENAWQYSKVYSQHLDDQGNPSPAYWEWAAKGWENSFAVRYPMGKGAKPEFCYWAGEKLGYLEARKAVYFSMYRDAVRKTEAFKQLQEMAESESLTLWDFDGYDHQAINMSLKEVLENPYRPMGHAFVLKAMLIYGPDVEPSDIR